MSINECKRTLGTLRIVKRELVRLQERRHEIKSMLEKCTPAYSGMPGGGSNDKLTELTAKIIEIDSALQQKCIEYLTAFQNIESMIAKVESADVKLAELLRLRYVDGKRWEDIASELHYSWKQIFRMQSAGIAIILGKTKR